MSLQHVRAVRIPPGTGGVLIVFLLVFLAACSDASASATATPVSWGMARDEASTLFELVSQESEARFFIGEILRGEPTTVVGKTNQVHGEIAFDPANPASTAIGPIQVDTRTLLTDNDFRNRAIATRILLSQVYQYITFVPTGISGLPDTVTPGETATFEITGDLTIVESTQPVVFDVEAAVVSDSRIEGSASTTIQRSDFDLFIPSATGVAGVEETVVLEIDFVATAVD